MPTKQKQTLSIENIIIGPKVCRPGATSAQGGGGLAKVTEGRPATIRCERIWLPDERIDVAAANDYGSQELLLLPNRDLVILACKMHCGDGTLSGGGTALIGFTSNAGSALFFGIGTAAASATPLSGTMQNVLAEKQGVDISPGFGKANGASNPNLFIAAGASNKLYLNIRDAVTASTGQMSFVDAFIDFCFLDLAEV